ncbi:methyltransferase domain-containing protein [Tumebacillus sp. ITR2]|uniref:Methyltransferase domain-containing protein n=1 Tax=Tumebacillus amylolyticus TaxID=2801339 RepID=A0ABS1JAF1_9BACL|nr:methyltransferase domain-containing protein [Tumebacillus amylolyticus]MBL0387261.1 methyltransferase domain-containing protein [Tumebacillus amylolyticus]
MQAQQLTEKWMFLNKFLESPKSVGSVTPSSRFLTDKMLKPVKWSEALAVAELGSGTGVFTRGIERVKRADCQLVLFEQDPEMRFRLAQEFPDTVCRHDAQELVREVESLGIKQLDAVISGLPFANFEQDVRDRILDQVVQSLKPGGVFVTFQYSLQMRRQLREKFDRVQVGFVPLNVPPAFVYVCYTSS